MLDTTGVDLGPLAREAATRHGIPVTLLLACAQAESDLNPFAERYGVPPDISFGLLQQTVRYAPFGDGSETPANIEYVKQRLFDRATALDVGAAHLKGNLLQAASADLASADGDSELGALVAYNSGSIPDPTSTYWSRYASNVQRYRDALAWARGLENT